MEPSPLYQGHQFKPAQAPQARLSPEIPFGQQYVNNLGETTKSLQRIEDALIQRNDNTILLQQEASEKEAALNLANELKYKLSLPDGAEGGLYDNFGRIRKDAVNNLRNKYLSLSRNWHKGLIDPEAAGKSALATNEYTTGVSATIEAALLANTKTRQKNAYMRNMELNSKLHEYDSNDTIIKQGKAENIFSETEAADLEFDNDKAKLAYTIDSTNDTDALLDMWEDPAMQEQLSYHPSLRNLLERKINNTLDTQGRAANEEHFTTSKTSKGNGAAGTSGKKPKALPPDGAPLYIQVLYAKYNGDFPENSEDAFKAIQRYLSENVDETDETETGAQQWNKARNMATAIGLKDTAFNKAYAFRKEQLSPGGVDPEKMLAAIPIHNWLNATVIDDIEIDAFEDELIAKTKKEKGSLTQKEVDNLLNAKSTVQKREEIKKNIAEAVRKEVIAEYNLWGSQYGDKADTRQKYTKLLDITLKLEKDVENQLVSKFIRNQLIAAEANIEKERMETADRRRWTQKMESDTLAGMRHLRTHNIRYQGVNMADLVKYLYLNKETPIPTTSTDLQFDYELAAPDSKLPDSKTHNIIYLPESTPLPNEKAHVYKRKGSLACTIEFRNSDKVQQPTPSRRLLASLGRATTPPTYIKWDGIDLDLGEPVPMSNNLIDEWGGQEWNAPAGKLPIDDEAAEEVDDGLSNDPYTEEESKLRSEELPY